MSDTEREALCTRIDELCAENEQLRQENQSIGMAAYELGRKSMADENAKLRELVAEMFNACPLCVNCAHNHLTVGWYDRMRELGVEVDK